MARNAAGGHKAGKKNRKHKRNAMRSKAQARYRSEARWLKNKAKKLAKHKKLHPNDAQANYSIVVNYKIIKTVDPKWATKTDISYAWIKKHLRTVA